MIEVPNLYSFATKELAQDAALAYILSWGCPMYRESHRRLHELGTAMLQEILATRLGDSGVPIVTSLDVRTQVKRIDVLALINDESEDGIVLIVEDKVGTDEHSNQIERYVETARHCYPGRRIVPVYMKTGNASRARLPAEEKCGRFLRRNLLGVLNRFRVKKAGRFSGGRSAAVAEITFGDDGRYVALKSGGMVDVDATMSRLDLIRGFVAEAAERSVGSCCG